MKNQNRSPKRSLKRYSLLDNIVSGCIGIAISAFIIPGIMTSQASPLDSNPTTTVSDTRADMQTVDLTEFSNQTIQIPDVITVESQPAQENTSAVSEAIYEEPIGPVQEEYGPAFATNLNATEVEPVVEIGPGIEPGIEEETVPEEEAAPYFEQVPFDQETQKRIAEIATSYDVPVEIVYGIMNRESNFNPSASNGRDFGACQIRDVNHKWINKQVGRQLNYLNVFDSAEAACIVYNNEKNNTVGSDNANMILMAYNMGPQGAKKNWKNGNYSSKYSRAVIEYATSLGWQQ